METSLHRQKTNACQQLCLPVLESHLQASLGKDADLPGCRFLLPDEQAASALTLLLSQLHSQQAGRSAELKLFTWSVNTLGGSPFSMMPSCTWLIYIHVPVPRLLGHHQETVQALVLSY